MLLLRNCIIASAYAARNDELSKATIADAKAAGIEEGVLEDAKASANLMGMNNVFYRFRHVIGKETYRQRPARLRMGRLVHVTSNKPDSELFSLAVSSINNCEACLKAHKVSAMEGGSNRLGAATSISPMHMSAQRPKWVGWHSRVAA